MKMSADVRKIIPLVAFLLLSFSCKKSRDAEIDFQKIASFEILGMKFGVDRDRFKEKSPRSGEFAGKLFSPRVAGQALDVEKALVTVSKKIIPRIVNVRVELTPEKLASKLGEFLPGELKEVLKGYDLKTSGAKDSPGRFSYGSGFFVSWDGYIATQARLVEGARSLSITTHDRKKFKAEVIGQDPLTNIAVIRVQVDSAVDPVRFGDSEKLRVGQMTISVGNPRGFRSTVVSGIVSSVPDPSFSVSNEDDFIQLSTPVSRGAAGGALVDLEGRLVGMNANSAKDDIGVGFAIPSKIVKSVVDQLVRKGRVVRSWFGADFQELTSGLAGTFNYNENGTGVLVSYIYPDSPAGKAGINVGDILISFADKELQGISHFKRLVSLTPFGTGANLKLHRDGRKINKLVRFDLEETLKVQEKKDVTVDPAWAGLSIAIRPIIGEDGKGVKEVLYVASVAHLSPSYHSGIRQEDIIISVNGKPVSTFSEYEEIVKDFNNDENAKIRYLLRKKLAKKSINQFVVVKRKQTEE